MHTYWSTCKLRISIYRCNTNIAETDVLSRIVFSAIRKLAPFQETHCETQVPGDGTMRVSRVDVIYGSTDHNVIEDHERWLI